MTALIEPPAGYLDAVGGTPPWPQTVLALSRASEAAWADPARLHHLGRQASLFLATARASLASSVSTATRVDLSADQVFWAPSMRQANAWALAGMRGMTQVAVSAIESLVMHDAVADLHLPTVTLPVDELGHVDTGSLVNLSDALVVVQAANVEIGTVQDLHAAAAHGHPVIADASQVLGRAPIEGPWSAIVADARGWGAPPGVAIIAVHPGAKWSPPIAAEGGWLGPGPNIPAAVAAATALENLLPHAADEALRHHRLIEDLRTRIALEIPDVAFAGDPIARLPHILNCSVLYVSGEALVSELDRRGFAVASGSACVADSDRASHVLVAIGAFTGGNLRISLPLGCSQQTIDGFVPVLSEAVQQLRTEAGR
ncbi:MAG: aminotransferase class V-fold PLP-dependent enzyme [Candidatus Nanopelagicales bacterium]